MIERKVSRFDLVFNSCAKDLNWLRLLIHFLRSENLLYMIGYIYNVDSVKSTIKRPRQGRRPTDMKTKDILD